MSRKIETRRKWTVIAELEITRPALSVQYVDKGTRSQKKRHFCPTDWLVNDTDIVWNVGKKMKGWIKEQVTTMKKSMADSVQYGIVCKSLPKAGYVKIAELSDIAPSRNWASFNNKDEYVLGDLPEPNVELVQTKTGSAFTFHYVIGTPVLVKTKIHGFAHNITPEALKNWMENLGEIKGLGDRHNSSEGYGTFTLKSYEIVEDMQIQF